MPDEACSSAKHSRRIRTADAPTAQRNPLTDEGRGAGHPVHDHGTLNLRPNVGVCLPAPGPVVRICRRALTLNTKSRDSRSFRASSVHWGKLFLCFLLGAKARKSG